MRIAAVFAVGLILAGLLAVGALVHRDYRQIMLASAPRFDRIEAAQAKAGQAQARAEQELTRLHNALASDVAAIKTTQVAVAQSLGTQLGAVANDMPAVRSSVRYAERELARLREDLAATKFALGKPSRPESIVLGDMDSYDSLDLNWRSNRDNAGRREVPCGSKDARAVVVVTLGQSNAGNHGPGRFKPKGRVDNFNLYDGRCYEAMDPLLGPSGNGGSFATQLGDMLIDRGLFQRVILAPIAMGGTTVEQWAYQGMFNRRITALIRRLHDAGLSADFILWHQGEGNFGIGDEGGRQYRKNLLEVIYTFRQYGVDAPFFVALVTRCGAPHPNPQGIREGQRSAASELIGAYVGPDTDTIGDAFRYDLCHFNDNGMREHAKLWADTLETFLRIKRPGTPTAGPRRGG